VNDAFLGHSIDRRWQGRFRPRNGHSRERESRFPAAWTIGVLYTYKIIRTKLYGWRQLLKPYPKPPSVLILPRSVFVPYFRSRTENTNERPPD